MEFWKRALLFWQLHETLSSLFWAWVESDTLLLQHLVVGLPEQGAQRWAVSFITKRWEI